MLSHFSSWSAFFQMGGYAAYVWPAYGIVMGVLIFHGFVASRQLKQLFKKSVGIHESEAEVADTSSS